MLNVAGHWRLESAPIDRQRHRHIEYDEHPVVLVYLQILEGSLAFLRKRHLKSACVSVFVIL